MKIGKQILKDSQGKEIGIFLPIEEYRALLEILEEIEDLKDIEEAWRDPEKAIPFDQAIKEIEAVRNDL